MPNKNVAVEVAKEIAAQDGSSQIITTANGVKIRIIPVSTALVEEVTNRIEDPVVPMWHNPDKDRDEPNPSDPAYLRAVDKANRARGIAVMDVMCMFGAELVDGVPEDNTWINKLRFMEKRGQVSLESFDLSDPLDLEFLYKRYIAVDNETIGRISELSMLTPEAVAKQENTFRGNKTR
jgi:hypothetical protein